MSDEFITNCKNIGSDLYGKVAEAIVEHGPLTDEEIEPFTRIMSIDMVRAVITDLSRRGLIKGTRVKDERKGWFVIKYEMVDK